MKSLKLRAWDKEKKEMFIVRGADFLIDGISGADDPIEGGLAVYRHFSHDWVNQHEGGKMLMRNDWKLQPGQFDLMSSIGIKDIEGVEIYEGDIIEFSYMTNKKIIGRGSVFWDEEEASFYHGFYEYDEGYDFYETRPPKRFWANPDISVRVIGDIFQNDELIGGVR